MRIEITHGSEGPRHDPYSVEEIAVTRRNGCRVTLRIGSLTGLSVRVVGAKGQGKGVRTYDAMSSTAMYRLFAMHAGVTLEVARRAYRKLRERCRTCGCRETRCVSGFPGETFDVCVRCGAVVDSSFDLSAVE